MNRAECCGSLVTSVITGDRCSCIRDGSGTEVRGQRVITARMLVVAFTFMICSLNLRGYIHAPGSKDAEGLETRLASPFHIPFFAQWQRMDRFWTRWALEIPSSEVTLLLLLSFCMCWSSVSSMPSTRALLSDWQGGRITAREGDHEDSLVLKRFFVDAFDSYMVLFYVGFFVRDPIRLCVELVSLYTADPVRRLLLETVILATAGLCGQG